MNDIEVIENRITIRIAKGRNFPEKEEIQKRLPFDKLKILNIQNSTCISIPKWLIECESLELLSFFDENNNIQIIENPIGCYPVFKSAIENQYDYISKNILELPDIEEIDYSFIPKKTFLNSLPNSIGDLSDLRYLGLANQNIMIIPETLGNCQYLNWLNLQGNPIKRIPLELFKLKNLSTFWIGSKHVTIEIKDINIFDKLPNLKSLSLKNCGLKTFPSSLKNLAFNPQMQGE